jgi:ribosomal protein S18 acetylase RimI-like enzyme
MNVENLDVSYAEEDGLDADEFLELARRVWPGDYASAPVQAALSRTINITARTGGVLIGSVRILTDGYLFGTIPEILVHPEHQGRGIGRRLMDIAWERSPTSLFLGARAGNEGFFEAVGFERGPLGFTRRRPRRRGEA